MDQGYNGEKEQALLGFHLSAGVPLDSSLAVCFKCCAGQGEEGGPRRHVLGTQLLRGQWLQPVRGRGGAAPRGEREEAAAFQAPVPRDGPWVSGWGSRWAWGS